METADIEGRLARLEQQDQRLTAALELLAQRETSPPAPRGRDREAYAVVIASLIGLLALAVSGYTAYVQREQLRAQVWPHLLLARSTVDPRYFLSNTGTGPAKIAALRVTIHGAPIKNRAALLKAIGFTNEELTWSTVAGTVLPAGKELSFIQPSNSTQSREHLIQLMHDGSNDLSMTVCYCSVLDDCWVASYGPHGPGESEGGCPIADAERFTD